MPEGILPAHFNAGYHNIFLNTLNDFGIIATMLYLSVFILCIKKVWQINHANDQFRSGLLFMCIACFMAVNFTSFNIGGLRAASLILTIIYAYAMNMPKKQNIIHGFS